MPALALGGLVGSLALASPAAADPAADASTKADIQPLKLEQIPEGGSNPSAEKTIWLDFAGGTITNTTWNRLSGYDELEYDPADKLSAAQKLEAYQRVVQAFAPFDVNVTVEKPAKAKLERSSMDDEEYGGIAHITDSSSSSPGFEKIFEANVAAGKGSVSGFGDPYEYDAWITTDVFGSSNQGTKRNASVQAAADANTYLGRIAGDIAAHELGHTVGLEHHGFSEGGKDYEYYTPGNDWTEQTASVWGPTMGAPLAGMHRWSNKYPNDHHGQDDLAVMTDDLSEKKATKKRLYDGDEVYYGDYCTNSQTGEVVKGNQETGDCYEDQPLEWQNDLRGRLEFRANQEANSDSVARVVPIENGKGSVWGEFVKNLGNGVGNWYVLDAAPGPINVNVTPQQPFSALDLKVTLYDAQLKQLDMADPGLENIFDENGRVVPMQLEGQGASVSSVGAANTTYFIKVEQTSFGDMNKNTATKASAAPKYGDLGTYQVSVEAQATEALASPTVDPTYGQTVTGTGVPGATVHLEDADDKAIGTAAVGPDGKWSITLDPAAKVGDKLLAMQVKDGLRSRAVWVTVIEEPKPEVSVKIDPTKITEGDDSELTVTGTGFESGQKVTGVVNSETVELGTKIADGEGKVEFIFDGSKLDPGKHKVTLTADDDKDYTGSVTFTVAKAPEDDDDDPSPSPEPTTTPSPDDDETPSPEPSDDGENPPPSDDGADDDGLPQTGAASALTLFGLGGIALVGAGATIAVAARRRGNS